MNPWIFNGKDIDSLKDIPSHKEVLGFVYKITSLIDGRIYIGKKHLHHSRKTRIGKREKKLTKTTSRVKIVVKESDWMDYFGSCVELKADVARFGAGNFRREIIAFACTSKKLTYLEIKHQFLYGVLEHDSYNGNILGRYYRKDLKDC